MRFDYDLLLSPLSPSSSPPLEDSLSRMLSFPDEDEDELMRGGFGGEEGRGKHFDCEI